MIAGLPGFLFTFYKVIKLQCISVAKKELVPKELTVSYDTVCPYKGTVLI